MSLLENRIALEALLSAVQALPNNPLVTVDETQSQGERNDSDN